MDLRQTVCCHVSSDGFLLRIPLDWGRVAQGGPGAGWGNQKSLRRYHSFNHASNAPINVDRGNVKVAGQFRISNSDNTSKKLRKVNKPIFFPKCDRWARMRKRLRVTRGQILYSTLSTNYGQIPPIKIISRSFAHILWKLKVNILYDLTIIKHEVCSGANLTRYYNMKL